MLVVQKVMLSFPVLCLIILCFFPSTQSLKNKDIPCKQYDACKCIFPTGRGINLASINKTLSVDVATNVSISVHFCGDVSFGNNASQCYNNVSVCYMNNTLNQSVSFGKTADLKFVSVSQFQPISIEFSNTTNTTKITLTCVKEAIDPLLIFKSKSPDGSVYELELQSLHACVRPLSSEEGPSGGLSMGSVLVIMLLVFTLVYFGGGMLTLRFLRGAEGKEMIPNVDFWTDLPYLVRDGILFTLNGFRPQTSYDRI